MNKNNKNNRRKREKKGRIPTRRFNNNNLVVYKQPGRFTANELRCVLRFTDITTSRSNIGIPSANWRYRSSAFDPDPLVLTGSIPGFAELANMYGMYLVTKMRLVVTLNNQETQGVIFSVWPSNNDNNNNSLIKDDIMEYSGNPRGQTAMAGNTTGMSRVSLTTTASLKALVGTHGFTDLDYSATTSANPLSFYYVNVAAATTLSNFAFPIGTRVVIDYHIKFFSLRQLES